MPHMSLVVNKSPVISYLLSADVGAKIEIRHKLNTSDLYENNSLKQTIRETI